MRQFESPAAGSSSHQSITVRTRLKRNQATITEDGMRQVNLDIRGNNLNFLLSISLIEQMQPWSGNSIEQHVPSSKDGSELPKPQNHLCSDSSERRGTSLLNSLTPDCSCLNSLPSLEHPDWMRKACQQSRNSQKNDFLFCCYGNPIRQCMLLIRASDPQSLITCQFSPL